ncbi:MAG: hypothetical protein AAF389_04955 [Gemmatimonadota bacterium]
MKRLSLPALTLALAVSTSACSTTIVAPSPVSPAVRASIESEGAQRPATIDQAGGETAAFRLRVTDESVVARSGNQPEIEIPHGDVRQIEFTRRGKGALDGALIGGAFALGTGLLTLTDEDDGGLFSESDTFILATIIVGAASVPIGALIGALIGHRVRFQFEGG